MKRNLLENTNSLLRNGLKINRLARIINEQWSEIWQTAIDRREQQLEHHRVLILAARDQLRKKAR
jgi:hypothetical protein